MSRYVKKKHGLTIGSDNLFSCEDEQGEMQFYPCIVSVSQLFFDDYSTIHTHIRSTAEQLLFTPVIVRETEFGYKTERVCYRLKPFWHGWLDGHCPGWGYPPLSCTDRVPSLFFAKRSHGLAFTNKVEAFLKGEGYRI